MAIQRSLDEAYMGCARAIALLSHAERKKVGAILVAKNNQGIIAEGFNGTPSGFDNCCEKRVYNTKYLHIDGDLKMIRLPKELVLGKAPIQDLEKGFVDYRDEHTHWRYPDDIYALETIPEVIHAEANAIAKVARSTNSSSGATLYCTLSPCFDCAKQIIQAGIVRVVYAEQYPYAEHNGPVRAMGLELLKQAKIKVEKL